MDYFGGEGNNMWLWIVIAIVVIIILVFLFGGNMDGKGKGEKNGGLFGNGNKKEGSWVLNPYVRS